MKDQLYKTMKVISNYIENSINTERDEKGEKYLIEDILEVRPIYDDFGENRIGNKLFFCLGGPDIHYNTCTNQLVGYWGSWHHKMSVKNSQSFRAILEDLELI